MVWLAFTRSPSALEVIELDDIYVNPYMFFMREFVDFFAALADPTRLRLLMLIGDGEVCVCHLQEVIQTNQPKISRHLRYLKEAGLVTSRRNGKWMHYRRVKLSGLRGEMLEQTLGNLANTREGRKDLRSIKNLCCDPIKQNG
ncbi:MAG: ArsR/SmtB family transcription factor [Verrucomicrobiales bacterium]